MEQADTYPRTTDRTEILARASVDARALIDYWDSKRGDRMMPTRADIDPLELKPWLTRLTLVDVAHDPRRLTYRLVGTQHVNLRGFDPTGRTVEEGYFGRNLEAAMENYRLVIDGRQPVLDWDDMVSRDGWFRETEALMLPLGDEATGVTMVLIFGDLAATPPL